MKAIVFTAPEKVEIQDLPVPEINDDEVLVRVHYCGICGTDVHIYHGNYVSESLPLVPGHEFSGTVEVVGKNVQNLTEGIRVVVDMHIPCHRCFYCRKAEFLNCPSVQQIGITRNGAFAEYVKVPARNVMPIASDLSLQNAVLVEPIACVVRSAKKSNLGLAKSVVILGCGSVGNLHLQLARTLGAAPIFVLEPSALRAKIAEEVGADFVITNPQKIREVVLEHTDGRGADVVIESVGREDLYRMAFDLIRPGGHVVGFGLTAPETVIPLDILDTVMKENSIKGTLAAAGQDMYDALTLVENKRFRLEYHTENIIIPEEFHEELNGDPSEKKSLKTIVKMI